MATKRSGRQKNKHSDSRLNGLMERLSAHFSQEEIHKIFGHSLLALDPAGLERMAAGLETETAAAVRKALKPTRELEKSKTPSHPTTAKVRQEWDSAWRDWDACISETADESGKYVLQEHHWEPPYLDKSGFAGDLEPIAARIYTLLPHVFERNLAPDFSFAQALLNTAEEIGGNSEDIEDSGEGLAFGPEVTRCLLEWEWKRARRDQVGGFEFLDGICALEHSGEDVSLDHSTIRSFVSALEPESQKEMLQGIIAHCQSGHWARALESVHGGWFALYKKLCRKWDPGRFLEVCHKGVLQDWRLALPVIDDLIARKAFQDAVALADQAAASMLRMTEGKAWDPRKGLILTESSFPYGGEKDRAIPGLLKRWNKAARAVGDNETACALELQLTILRDWTGGDAILQALHRVPPRFDAIEERIYEDWTSLIAVWSVEGAMDEVTESEHGWIHSMIDATRAGTKGPAMFRRDLLRWINDIGKTRKSVRDAFKSLAVLTLDLDSASELKKASPALHCLLLREPEGDRRVTKLRRTWLKRLRAGALLPEVIQFWKRHAAWLVPDPEHSAGDYRDCAEWLAVLHDFDAPACKKIVEQWKLTHRRRKNLWNTLERAKLISY